MITALIITVFILGYTAIAFEHPLKLNKAASALITGVLCWTIYILQADSGEKVSSELLHHMGEIASILFFLLGAMTVVELIDSHNGFDIITEKINTTNKQKLFFLISIITFFLSALLDNLTTAIVMTSLCAKLLQDRKDRLWFAGMIVIAANAGGAWSPLGDVTTTMLWIGGQITALNIMKELILPSIAVGLVPALIIGRRFKSEKITPLLLPVRSGKEKTEGKIILFTGIGFLVFVPVFKTLTQLPPFMGMLLALGLMWVITTIIHKGKEAGLAQKYTVTKALQKVDTPSILFFLGILLAVTALQSIGILKDLALGLNRSLNDDYLIGSSLGLLSAVVDNVPLVAASQGMYDLGTYPADHHFWEFLALTTGTGGSAIIIGSAAGVAVMGIERIDFMWYLRKISWIALIGFIAGIAVFFTTSTKLAAMSIKAIYQGVLNFLRTKLSRVQFIMVIATLVGFSSGLVAVLLKSLVHRLQYWVEDISIHRYAYLLFPAIGLLVTVFIIRYFFRGQLGKGIAMVLKAIARKSSFIPVKHTYAHVVTSSITVGLGGSVGLEAPIVATGSALGSNIARISDLNYQERSLLIACGAAAGISAVFNAPIAGVIFAVEVLLTETVVSYFIPLIISSVVGVLCSKVILQESSLFNFILKQNFDYNNVPFYILMGILAGFVSLYYARIFKHTEHRIKNWHFNIFAKAMAGGILLLGIYFILPPLFGEGYESVKLVANGSFNSFTDNTSLLSKLGENWGIIAFTALIVLFKPIAAGITIGSGGNGGNFAPSLFAGSYLGFFFSKLINITPWVKIPVGNFSLVGMAGLLSGVMYCPLTAIFLIAEITNGYELFIPLMIVSSISFFIVKSYEPYSMDLKKLALEGEVFTHKKEKNILTSIVLSDMLQDKYEHINIDKNLKELVDIIKKSEKSIFAVTDNKGKFAGIIELNDIKQKLFQPEQFDKVSIRSIMKKPATLLRSDNNMHEVMEKFDITQSWYLPVLDHEKKFLGFISKTKLFNKYREILSGQRDLYES